MKPPIEDLAKARFLIDQISDDFKHLVMLYESHSDEDFQQRLRMARRGASKLTMLINELQRHLDGAVTDKIT